MVLAHVESARTSHIGVYRGEVEVKNLRQSVIRGGLALILLAVTGGFLLMSPVTAGPGGQGLNKLRRNLSIIYGRNTVGGAVADTPSTVADLEVPKGNYAIFATVELLSPAQVTVECWLDIGTNRETKSVTVVAGGRSEIVLNYAHAFTARGAIFLRCADNNAVAATTWDNAAFTVLKMPKLTTGVDISA
jgi:hypothetical protein